MPNRPCILVANPDRGIETLLRRNFGAAGFTVVTADTARSAISRIAQKNPDLIVLSADFEDIGGSDFVRQARAVSSSPIIVLFHPNRMTMPRDLLDGGADDCVEEPFLVQELAARARRLLVRAGVWLHKRIVLTPAGSLEVDPLARTARLGDRRLDLTGLEFKLLVVLLGAGGSPVSHDELLRRMWGEHRGSTQNLRRVIATLRDTIEQDPKQPALLISVRGIGYRLNVSEDPSAASDNSLET